MGHSWPRDDVPEDQALKEREAKRIQRAAEQEAKELRGDPEK